MHVHTTLYSKCGRQTPQEMAMRAMEVGLDGVVITEHNVLWKDEEIDSLRAEFPDLVFLRGVEVSAKGHHVLVYGVTDFDGFERGMPVSEVARVAHARGAVAVLAHPLQHVLELSSDVLEIPFDAIETRSINIDPMEHSAYVDLASTFGLPEMWNSDAHHTVTLGTYGTRFERPILSEKELADAIRRGAFATVEQTKWSVPAWVLRDAYWENQIVSKRDEGIEDHLAIKQKTGASLKRIARALAV